MRPQDQMRRRVEFELLPEHVSLLRRAYVDWQDCETGAPEINPKRPYGNSSVALDVAEILGASMPPDDDRGREEWERTAGRDLMDLHYDTATALQIVLATGAFQPGRYVRDDPYTRDWRPADAEEVKP